MLSRVNAIRRLLPCVACSPFQCKGLEISKPLLAVLVKLRGVAILLNVSDEIIPRTIKFFTSLRVVVLAVLPPVLGNLAPFSSSVGTKDWLDVLPKVLPDVKH